MSVTAAQAIANYQSNPNTAPQVVIDSAANVAANLDGLETLASANDIVEIIVPYRSTLAITLAQLANDDLALALMTPHAITIADTAENVMANLGEVIQLVDLNKIFSIAVTDGAITLAGAVGPVVVTTRVLDAFLSGGTTVFLGNGGSSSQTTAQPTKPRPCS